MIDEVLEAFDLALHHGPEAPYRHLGGLSMSSLGGCRRQGAYWLSETPPAEREHDPDNHAAEVGTALHEVLLPRVAEDLEGQFEVIGYLPPEFGVEVPGTVDLDLGNAVVDLKTVGRTSFDLLHAPKVGWRMQVTAGAVARGAATCGVVVLCRDTGRLKGWEWATEEEVPALEEWLDAADHDPEEVPRDFRGPGLDRECDWCPFAAVCWPEVEGAEPQAVLVKDDADTARMLEAYLDARSRKEQAEADMKFARSCLSGSEEGQYGSVALRWKHSKGRESLDATAAKQILEDAGLPVPIKVSEGSTSIDVRRVQ